MRNLAVPSEVQGEAVDTDYLQTTKRYKSKARAINTEDCESQLNVLLVLTLKGLPTEVEIRVKVFSLYLLFARVQTKTARVGFSGENRRTRSEIASLGL